MSLRQACAAAIDGYDGGYFHGCDWLRAAFMEVPREHFVPDRVWWPNPQDGHYPLLDRTERPRQWLKAVYRPLAALITQIDDGRVRPEDGPATGGSFTSSISCSAVIVDMLHHLGPQPYEKVLEIGTGSGYTTALLAHRVGAGNVVTMEIDDGLAERAAGNLTALDLTPRTVVGDGEAGYAAAAPYDRILSTAAVRDIPAAWPKQVRPGGVIVTPLDTPYATDALLKLVCDGHGNATGHLIKAVSFMKTRAQRPRRSYEDLGWPGWTDHHVTIGPDGQHIRTT
ncbi:methyltransferase domain-containing protein [Streptomyces sp. CB02923]|uniref:methyltransferase domain-containing protein n=1 Tax=Streptomyces sp. CB02923 TaxID=1718985 RepID=UPI001F5B78B6|nr:methyltransferase domain-containing protein [Streptomyces sp. CB02923]